MERATGRRLLQAQGMELGARRVTIYVRAMPDGSYWATGPMGSMRRYSGEAARAIELVLRYSK